jgi:hypothetical protein
MIFNFLSNIVFNRNILYMIELMWNKNIMDVIYGDNNVKK